MTIRHAGLAFLVIAAVGAASGKAQMIEGSHQRLGNTSALRIAPLAGQGPVQNVVDLLNLRGVDAAIVPSDVLPYLRDGRFPDVGSSIAYIKKLDQEVVHILARQDFTSVTDLAGKKVNFDLRDSRAFITGSVLFRALKINVQPVSLDQPRALQQLRLGEIAATVHVAKSPAHLFFDLNRDDRVHFLPVPYTEEVSRTYLPARLAPADYPLLIGGGEVGQGVPIATVAVPIVLAVNSRALEIEGNRDISQLIDAASASAIAQEGSISSPTSRPDVAWEVPGWRRFVPTERRLKGVGRAETAGARTQSTPQPASQGTSRAASARQSSGASRTKPITPTGYTDQQRQALFQDFLRWREQSSPFHKQSHQADQDVFNEFMRSLGKP